MNRMISAILDDDRAAVRKLLKTERSLATRLMANAKLHKSSIFHWIYAGDTALHLAAAGYRMEIAELLLDSGADPNAARNHRRSGPLHYAADGFITGPVWDARRQVEMLGCLPSERGKYPFAGYERRNGFASRRANAMRCRGEVSSRVRQRSGDKEQTWVNGLSSRGAKHRARRIGSYGRNRGPAGNHQRVSFARRESPSEKQQWKNGERFGA
jgi:ankyrin repeat protein